MSQEAIDRYNEIVTKAAQDLPFTHEQPIALIKWIHVDKIRANDYNPNSVARNEMRLLHTSISADGYTQPIVTIEDDENPDTYIIVDGFHRYTVLRTQQDIYDRTNGYLPIVVINKPIADRMASTVRHNRARGKHSINGMGTIVFDMLDAGESDATICNKLGLEPEELARLKHITGFSKLFTDHQFSRPTVTQRQLDAKAEYRKENPDAYIPTHI